MITHHTWIRLFVISLIFLGYGAFTSNTIHQPDNEAAFPTYTFEAYSSVFSNDPEPGEKAALCGDSLLKTNQYLACLTLTDVAIVATYTSRFKSFKPRAPPATV